MLHIFRVDAVSFSLCPERAACGPTGSTKLKSTQLNWLFRTNGLVACYGLALLDSDVEYHLQQAAKVFQKHRWMLQCKDCCIKHRLRYCESVVSSTACFAAEHRPSYRRHLEKYDVQFRKRVPSIVGPPPGTNGMIFCMNGICAWITGAMPVEFLLGQRKA